MAETIRYIDNLEGDHVYPVTHIRGVIDDEGVKLQHRLEGSFGPDITFTETKQTLTFVSGYIKGADGTISTTSATTEYVTIALGDAKYVRFLGAKGLSNWGVGYAFYDDNDTPISYSKFDVVSSNPHDEEYALQVPYGAATFRTSLNVTFNDEMYMKEEDFYCYLQSGDSVSDAIVKKTTEITSNGHKLSIIGAGNTGVYSEFFYDIVPGHKYRLHIDKWDMTGVTSGSSYTKLSATAFLSGDRSVSLLAVLMPDTLEDYYDFTIPTDCYRMRIFGRCKSGFEGTTYLRDITYVDGELDDIKGGGQKLYLTGAGSTVAQGNVVTRFTPGHGYRIYIDEWDRRNTTTSSSYYIFGAESHDADGNITNVVRVPADTALEPFYDFTMPDNAVLFFMWGRAKSGTTATAILCDITTHNADRWLGTNKKYKSQRVDVTFEDGYISKATGEILSSDSGAKYVTVEVGSAKYVHFRGAETKNDSYSSGYAWYDADDNVMISSAWASGANSNASREYIIKVPSDAAYFRTTVNAVDNVITEGNFFCSLITGDVASEFFQVVDDLELIQSAELLNNYTKKEYTLAELEALPTGEGGVGATTYTGSSLTRRNKLIPCQEGDIFFIKSNKTQALQAAFVSTFTKSTYGGTIPYPAGQSLINPARDTWVKLVATKNCNGLRFTSKYTDDNDRMPQEVIHYQPKEHRKPQVIGTNLVAHNGVPTIMRTTGVCFKMYPGYCYTVIVELNGETNITRYSSITTVPAQEYGMPEGWAKSDESSSSGSSKYFTRYYDTGTVMEERWLTIGTANTGSSTRVSAILIEEPVRDAETESLLRAAQYREVDLSQLTKRNYRINGYSAIYTSDSAIKHVIVPVRTGQYVKIVSNNIAYPRCAWLASSANPVAQGAPDWAGGIYNYFYVGTGATRVKRVPEGASYLFLAAGSSSDGYQNLPAYVGIFDPEEASSSQAGINDTSLLRYRIESRSRTMGLTPLQIETDANGWELPTTVQQLNSIKKSLQMCNIKWTPKATLPGKTKSGNTIIEKSDVHKVGVQQTGIPYSGNWHEYKYVGIEVSIHTFMTAVNNPYSLIYTEDIFHANTRSAWGKTYYNTNGWMYYGTVCCGFTSSVNGQPTKYGNVFMPKESKVGGIFIPVYNDRDFNNLRIGDVYDNTSHSFLVYGLHRDANGDVDQIKIAESTGGGVNSCHIVTYTKASFTSLINRSGNYFHAYRISTMYANTDYEPSPYVPLTAYGETVEPVVYNNDICCFAGDKATFMAGNRIAVNYNLTDSPSHEWTAMEIYKDDVLLSTVELANIDQTALHESQQNHAVDLGTTLTKGMYKARMTDGTNYSDYTYWEVLGNSITVTSNGDGSYDIANGSNGGKMVYVYGGQFNGSYFINYIGREPVWDEYDSQVMRLYYDKLAQDFGYNADKMTQIRVMLKGTYGMAATAPILLPGKPDIEPHDEEEEEQTDDDDNSNS